MFFCFFSGADQFSVEKQLNKSQITFLEVVQQKSEDNFRKKCSDASTKSCKIKISKRTRNKKAKKQK